jgi:hypothetical protein
MDMFVCINIEQAKDEHLAACSINSIYVHLFEYCRIFCQFLSKSDGK